MFYVLHNENRRDPPYLDDINGEIRDVSPYWCEPLIYLHDIKPPSFTLLSSTDRVHLQSNLH